MAEQTALQTALADHFEASLSQPLAMSATVDGVEMMGFADTAAAVELSIAGVIDLITAWLKTANVLPPKEDVLQWVGEAFDTYIATRPPLAGRPFLTKLARQGLLTLVSSLYDSIGA